jgi:GTP-binding protein
MEAKIVHVAASAGSFPEPNLPEVAIMGRSNCGKSTVINTFVGMKKLARTSSTPGRTRQILFFEVAERFNLVDLPGYGYAQVSKTDRAAWQKLIESYLSNRHPLVAACLLIDIRRDLKQDERDLLHFMQVQGVPMKIVLTKEDRMKNTKERSATMRRWKAEPSIKGCGYIVTSSKTRQGFDELRTWILQHVEASTA